MANKPTRKSFDFRQYPDVFDALDNQANMTKYIVDLIRADIKKIPNALDKEAVLIIIEEYLASRNIITVDKPLENSNNDRLKESVMKTMQL